MAHLVKKNNISKPERASSFTSKGSLTLEAALAVPVFFFTILCMVYLLEAIHLQIVMTSALHSVARELAEEAYVQPYVIDGMVEHKMKNTLGERWMEHSLIEHGVEGLDCRKSRAFGKTGIMELSVRYQVRIPIFMIRVPLLRYESSVRVKGWNGYAGNGWDSSKEETVYITDYGLVYHKNPDCTYLDLSIQSVDQSQVGQLRNEDGKKYRPCEFCVRKHSGKGQVYITGCGTKYHSSLSCIGLKRTVYAVPISEVFGRGGCSRCVR